MSHKHKMVELRQQLERWRSHNEVHAKPADQMLYEFLSKLLKMGEEDEMQDPIQFPVENYEAPEVQAMAEDEGPGGNHPTDPSGNP